MMTRQGAGAQGLTVDVEVGNEPADQVVAILRDADAQSVTQVKERGLNGIETVIAAVVAVKGLARLAVRLSQIWTCAVVVDAREPRILAAKKCDLPQGTVEIILRDGKRSTLTRPSERQVESAVAVLGPTP